MMSSPILPQINATTTCWGLSSRTCGMGRRHAHRWRTRYLEWWYFDAEYGDGTKIVPRYFSPRPLDVAGARARPPLSRLPIRWPQDSQYRIRSLRPPLKAARDKAKVQIKNSSLEFTNGQYIVHFSDGNIDYNSVMTPRAPMWRPNTGISISGLKRTTISLGSSPNRTRT